MSIPEIEVGSCLGQFQCELSMLARLLGFPDTVKIKNIQMVPYSMCNRSTVRFVVEDEENLPGLKDGDELTPIAPKFRLGPGYHEFMGWNIYEQKPVEDSASGIQEALRAELDHTKDYHGI